MAWKQRRGAVEGDAGLGTAPSHCCGDALFRLGHRGGYILSKDFYKPRRDTLDKLDRFLVATHGICLLI